MQWMSSRGPRPLIVLAWYVSVVSIVASIAVPARAQMPPPLQADALSGGDGGAWPGFARPASPPDLSGPLEDAAFAVLSQGGPWPMRDRTSWPDGRLARLLGPARAGQWGRVIEAIQQDAPDLDGRDRDGATLLTLAARSGRLDAVLALLRHGAEVERVGLNGLTPLGAAAIGGHDLVTQALLRAGADTGRWTAQGQTPLHLAAREGHLGSMRALLKAGANPMAFNRAGLHPLAEAASTGQVPALALLVDEAGVAADARDRSGLNALHAAAVNRHAEAVSWLRGHGATLPHPLTQVLLDRPADPLPAMP